MVIVILFERERLHKRCARNEDSSDPMVNHSARHGNSLAVVQRLEFLDDDFSFAQLRVRCGATLRLQAIHPEKCASVRELGIDPCLRQLGIVIERCYSFGFELRRVRCGGKRERPGK